VTQAIGNDKIPTSTADQRPSQPRMQSRHPEQHPPTPSAGTAAGPAASRPADLERASHLYAQQPAEPATATPPASAADALALARRLREAMLSAPAAALNAQGGVKQLAAEAALAPPAA
jgi:hypothetical protein